MISIIRGIEQVMITHLGLHYRRKELLRYVLLLFLFLQTVLKDCVLRIQSATVHANSLCGSVCTLLIDYEMMLSAASMNATLCMRYTVMYQSTHCCKSVTLVCYSIAAVCA
jgi:hypothetical protein